MFENPAKSAKILLFSGRSLKDIFAAEKALMAQERAGQVRRAYLPK
jgi:hypothetical protein